MKSFDKRLKELLANDKVEVANDAVAAALTAHNDQQRKNVNDSIVDILTAADNELQSSVRTLRQIRKDEVLATKKVKRLDRAIAYFKATGNPLPLANRHFNPLPLANRHFNFTRMCDCVQSLACRIGSELPNHADDPKAFEVPEDWNEPNTKEPE